MDLVSEVPASVRTVLNTRPELASTSNSSDSEYVMESRTDSEDEDEDGEGDDDELVAELQHVRNEVQKKRKLRHILATVGSEKTALIGGMLF